MKKRLIINTLLCLCSISPTVAQQAYFVDGYHGGVYGHYPMWNTQFMVDKLKVHPEWAIGLEIEPETWDTVKVKEPQAYANFKAIVDNNRVDFTNPTYAQPYCFNISGESIIRQFGYGIKKTLQHFPNVKFTTYSAEEPCFTSSLPQILKSFGFNYAVLKNPDTCWGGYMRAYGGESVNWIGPDNTSILTVPRYLSEGLEKNSTWQTQAWNNNSAYLDACFAQGIKNPVGMCYQDAGWKNGPWIGNGDQIQNKSKYTTWTNYFEHVLPEKSTEDFNLSQEDVLVSLMWGSQVLQRIAQEVRSAENSIISAEKIATISYIENNYIQPQPEVDEAWRTLMMAQHHDSWIVPYNRLKGQRTWADEISSWTSNTNNIAHNIIANATSRFSRSPKHSDMGYVRVFNTMGIKRSEIIEIQLSGNLRKKDIIVYNAENKPVESYLEKDKLVFRATVPSFGYATYKLGEGKPSISEEILFDESGNCILENDMYKIVLDKKRGGTIKSLIAKKAENKEYADADGLYSLCELRGFFYDENKFRSSTEDSVSFTVLENNFLKKSIKIKGSIASHPFTQIITINAGQRKIDFQLNINWQNNIGIGEYKQGDNWQENRRAFYDDRYKLNVLFPTSLSSPSLYKDAPFDVCKSQLNNTFYHSWDSIKNTIILNWVDLVENNNQSGFAVFTDHTTSYSYGDDFPLGLTAQYSGKGLWGPDYKITQPLNINYAIVPHEGKWNDAAISTENVMWNEPLHPVFYSGTSLTDASYIDIENSGYTISAVTADNEDILIRLFNAEGNDALHKIIFRFAIKQIEEVELNGKVISTKVIQRQNEKSAIEVSMPRFGIRTFRIKKLNI